MILSGASIVTRSLVQNLRSAAQQQQPCGVDLTVRQISRWTSAATVDFDNTARQAAGTSALPFGDNDTVTLHPGAYLLDFNESVSIPTDCMATVLPRSSLWRAGVSVHAGVVDAGYHGALGVMMDVRNPCGVVVHRNAKLAQIVFQQMEGPVEGYEGIYQASLSSAGRDGAG